ncbi:MAG TPA: glycosyltransferase [Sphingopyxis sp.]|nr:glycosyltransferase [Sphingopyxis sp.]
MARLGRVTIPMAPKKVLHIITGLQDGGAEAILYRLCRRDVDDVHHVVSLTGPGKYGPLLEAAGVKVTCLDMPRGQVKPKALIGLWQLIRRIRPDAIQTFMYHADLVGGVVGRLAGVRNISWGIHHSTLSPAENARSTILVARICARLSHFVPRKIICCADKGAEVHAALGYDAKRLRVIQNGYDLAVYRPDREAGNRFRTMLGIGNDPTIGFVARFVPEKDHDNLFRALAILKRRGLQPACLLAGAGMDRQNAELVAMLEARDLIGDVVLLGQQDDIPALMNGLDLHVMSSISEGFPNVLAEAMACGTPCVSTDVGDAADIVGGTGWIVPPGDPDALAAAIEAAIQERSTLDWPKRKMDARHRVETQFSIEAMVRQYRDAWFGPEVSTVPSTTEGSHPA